MILSSESVDVTADSQGRLAAVYVEIGDAVRQGDRLASLDPRIVAQDLEMARSALRASEADAGRAAAEQTGPAPWERFGGDEDLVRNLGEIRDAGFGAMDALRQIMMNGTDASCGSARISFRRS